MVCVADFPVPVPACDARGVFRRAPKLANGVLLVASLVFYARRGAVSVPRDRVRPIQLRIGAHQPRADLRSRKHWLALGVTGNLTVLAIFKYANFAVANVRRSRRCWRSRHRGFRHSRLPLGISFFTFHAILVCRGRLQARRRPSATCRDFALYILAVSAAHRRADHPLPRHCRATRRRATQGLADFVTARAGSCSAWQEGADREHARPLADQIFALPAADLTTPLAGSASSATRCRSISTSPAIRTWRSASRACSASASWRISTIPTSRAVDPGILAPLAHLAVDLVPRLPLHSARRQPARREARLCEPRHRVSVVRPLARRELDVRAVGRMAWRVSGGRARRARSGVAQDRRARATSTRCWR